MQRELPLIPLTGVWMAQPVYQFAENALDRAKKEGKNMLIFFSPEDYQKKLDQIELLDELKSAVDQGCRGFYLCYQPQIDSKNYGLYGAEALLRYESEKRGMVATDQFIPLLEQSGLICEVGLWALEDSHQTERIMAQDSSKLSYQRKYILCTASPKGD